MPKRPLVRVDVSWQAPKILLLGADTFLGSNFLRQLLGKQLEIWTVVNQAGKIETKPHLKIFSLAQDWLSALPEKIDYIVDFLNLSESFDLAFKSKARLLTVWDEEKGSLKLEREKNQLDWRVVKTAFVYGPTSDLGQLTFLNQVLVSAVLNEKITIPFSQTGQVYPLYLTDFCAFLEQALFSPVLENQELVLVGKKVSWQNFLNYLEKKAQFTKGVRVEPDLVLPEIKDKEQKFLQKEYDWKPETNWQRGVDKALQFFFQKKEKGELRPNLVPETSLPVRESVKARVVKAPRPVLAEPVIDRDFWQEPEKKTKKRLKKKKTKVLEPVVIRASWQKEEERFEKIEKKEVKRRPFRLFWSLPLLMLLILAYLFSPWFLGGAYFGLGSWRLYQSLGASKLNRWPQTATKALSAQRLFEKSLSYGVGQRLLALARTGKRGARVLEQVAGLSETGLVLTQAIWQEEGETELPGEQLLVNQESLTRELSLLEAELAGKTDFLPFIISRQLSSWREMINKGQLILTKSGRLLANLDWWLGEEKPRRFLIVFQNSMELRPTGGFIGSLATLEMSGGKLAQFKVQDVYTVDGQLKGYVEPPLPIKKILGESGWYLRDSNWSPDFPTSAAKIAWFFQKETGQAVDGVIGLNLQSAQKIISQIGEIYLPDFAERINADNLFAKAEFYSEASFFPGSQQKASFLTALIEQLLAIVQNTPGQVWQPLSKSLWGSLEEKELLLWTTNESVNQALMINNWDGRVKSTVINLPNSFSDYLFPVEANLGVNKANYFLRRTLSLLVEVEESGKFDYLLQLHYENTAQSTKWPGGAYKNYLRLLLPLGAEINRVIVFDPLVGKENSRRIISRGEITQSQEKDKMSVGFLIEVPINSRRTVEVSYSRKFSFNDDGWHYLLYLQKQSGIGDTPLTVLISLPKDLKPLQISQAATLTDQGLVFEGQFGSDWPIAIEFSR